MEMKTAVLNKEQLAVAVESLLTLDELVAALKIKKSWVYGRIHAGNLPFPVVKIGHYNRFPSAGVQQWIESQMKVSA
jgi:excisionase family DNA binding protein